jgi:hypothetical protein
MSRLFDAIAKDEVLSAGGAGLGITWRKASEYLGLFCFLLAIYWLCISSYVRFIDAEPPSGYGFGDLIKPLIGTCLISAFPFGALAYRDKTWRSNDAARVIIATGMAVYMGLSLQYDRVCLYFVAVLLAMVPFVLCAQCAHKIGTLCRPRRHDDMKSTNRP